MMIRTACAAVVSALILGFGPSANATVIGFTTQLSGPNESPPNNSVGTGNAVVKFDTLTGMLSIDITFSGLSGTTTASHIHCCTAVPQAGTAGVATQTPFFVGFPIGVTSGTYSHIFDMSLSSSYNGAFIAANGGSVPAAEAALIAGIEAGKSYLNVNSTFRPGGEIRGFLVPEPGTLGLFAAGLLGMAVAGRRRIADLIKGA